MAKIRIIKSTATTADNIRAEYNALLNITVKLKSTIEEHTAAI